MRHGTWAAAVGLALGLGGTGSEALAAACMVRITAPASGAVLVDSPEFRWSGTCPSFRLSVSASPAFGAGALTTAWGPARSFQLDETSWEAHQVSDWAGGGYFRVEGRGQDGVVRRSETRAFSVDPDLDDDGASQGDGDCDDADPAVFAGAPEVCGDGADQDCDGADTPCGPPEFLLDEADAVAAGETSRGALGQAIAWGDVDGDGDLDLAVAGLTEGRDAHRAGVDAAGVWVFAGPVGGDLGSGQAAAVVRGLDTDGRRASVSMDGDLDGDGRADLVVGSFAEGAGSGEVLVFFGPLAGELWPDDAGARLAGTLPGGAAGLALDASADLDSDGTADLVIAAPGSASGPTEVYVVYGPVTGARSLGQADAVVRGDAAHGFGADVLAADVDGDGVADLVVSEPDRVHGAGRGAVRVFRGPLLGSYQASDADVTLWADVDGGDLGLGLAADADLTGDGIRDLVVVAPALPAADGSETTGAALVFAGPVGADRSTSDADAEVRGAAGGRSFGGDGGGGTVVCAGADRGHPGTLLVLGPDEPGASGRAQVLYRFDGPLSGRVDAGAATAAYAGAWPDGASEGIAAASYKDGDGDGIGDVWLGLPAADDLAADAGAVRGFAGTR